MGILTWDSFFTQFMDKNFESLDHLWMVSIKKDAPKLLSDVYTRLHFKKKKKKNYMRSFPFPFHRPKHDARQWSSTGRTCTAEVRQREYFFSPFFCSKLWALMDRDLQLGSQRRNGLIMAGGRRRRFEFPACLGCGSEERLSWSVSEVHWEHLSSVTLKGVSKNWVAIHAATPGYGSGAAGCIVSAAASPSPVNTLFCYPPGTPPAGPALFWAYVFYLEARRVRRYPPHHHPRGGWKPAPNQLIS